MEYIDAFVAAVPKDNRDAYIKHAREMAPLFKQNGALRLVETWGDDIPEGELTSFPQAVKLKGDEAVVFSWIVWPSAEVRNQAWEIMMQDERMDPEKNQMPFDGMRMIYGGFDVIIDE